MSAIRGLRLRLDAPLTGLPGARDSMWPGAGTSFVGHRDYHPGDDVRLIDWNVFARHRRPSIKLFQRDRSSQLLFIIDASGSMREPDPRKWEVAVEAVSLLCELAAANGDRVGCIAASAHVELVAPLRMGERQARALGQSLATLRPTSAGTHVSLALVRATSMLRRPSAVVIASDCLDSRAPLPDWISRLSTLRRHRVTLLSIASPLDLALPDVGLVRLVDAETGERHWVDTHAVPVRQAYARAAAVRRRELLHRARSAGVATVELLCDRPIIPQLAPLVERRR